MSTSSDPSLATLRIAAPPFVEISIVDDDLREVPLPDADGSVSDITMLVPPGTYDVTFRAADARHSVLAWAHAGHETKVELPEPLRFSTPAPYEGTSTTREYQRGPAAQLSSSGHASGAGTAALFVFVRNPSASPGTKDVLHDVELSFDGVDLAHAGAHSDVHAHWAGLHVAHDPGSARLAFTMHGRRYEQSLELVADYQTQVFVLATEHGIEPGGVSIAICERARGFDPASPIQRQTALAMRALERGRWERGLDRSVLFGGIEESPLLAILGAHLLVQGEVKEHDVPIAVDVAQQLDAKLGAIPDVVALRLALRVKLGTDPLAHIGPIAPLERPPMLYRSWKRWVQASQDDVALIPEGSVGDRLAFAATSSGPWLTWTAGALEPGAPQRKMVGRLALDLDALGPPEVVGYDGTLEERADRLYRQMRLPRATARREAAPLIAQLASRVSTPIARDDIAGEGGWRHVPPGRPVPSKYLSFQIDVLATTESKRNQIAAELTSFLTKRVGPAVTVRAERYDAAAMDLGSKLEVGVEAEKGDAVATELAAFVTKTRSSLTIKSEAGGEVTLDANATLDVDDIARALGKPSGEEED
ncbi:MAG: hypothetical protein AB7S26_13255 [Sandaracinaceae bacterium]